MTYDISIVIVNYNVRHFLEQTLASIQRASNHLKIETWVVDNDSVDDSISMVKRNYPKVKLIENKDNVGFSVANNQAIEQSSGKYILLLNPDTVLQEDTLDLCFKYMENHQNTGAVGVKMIDGSGQFLPESKRGFPNLWVSFCKSTGLSSLFPKSPIFNQYHLGYLDKNEIHKVEVLSGAFMFMRKEVLDQVGNLDEAFFMYGEDIDLSYRIKDAGYDIVYYPETTIIHFKGESTKKGSLNYVRVFYQAMIIFANKHYAGKGAGIFSLFLRLAILARASLSMVKRVWIRVGPLLVDSILSVFSYYLVSRLWAQFYFHNPDYFSSVIWYNIIGYSAINIFVFAFQGMYTPKIRFGSLLRGVFIALLLCLAIYGLLNNTYRNSRAILVIGTLIFGSFALLWRSIRSFIKYGNFHISHDRKKNILVVGSGEEFQRIKELLSKSLVPHQVVGIVAPQNIYDQNIHTGKIEHLNDLVKVEKVDEIIFSIKDLEWKDVMKSMSELGPNVQYKMVGDEQISILGSQSKNIAGELYTVDFHYNINEWRSHIAKRIVDIIFSVLFLLFSWLLIFFQKRKGKFIQNIFQVFIGMKTWVGYDPRDEEMTRLPKVKDSVVSRAEYYGQVSDKEIIKRINILYAKDYFPWLDVETIFNSLHKLDG